MKLYMMASRSGNYWELRTEPSNDLGLLLYEGDVEAPGMYQALIHQAQLEGHEVMVKDWISHHNNKVQR